MTVHLPTGGACDTVEYLREQGWKGALVLVQSCKLAVCGTPHSKKEAVMPEKTNIIKLALTQQQWILLDRLKEERRWGKTREEIVLNVFRDYVKQELGE